MSELGDRQLLRYSQQILLPEVGIEGQQRLLNSSVLIVGLGGLGSPVAMYLAAAGVGRLVIADNDRVELSNLQRQIIHSGSTVGMRKTESASRTLRSLNPEVSVETVCARLDADLLAELLPRVDLVVDGCDNFETRYAVNRACVVAAKPLVSGAAIRMEGQVAVFAPQPGKPCYECLYNRGAGEDEPCVENGVLAPIVGIVGSVQATEVLKLLLGIGKSLEGRLLLLDGLRMEWKTIAIPPDPACPACSVQAARRIDHSHRYAS